jgi:hypothetical protein
MCPTRILAVALVATMTLAATPGRPDDKKPAPQKPTPTLPRLPTEAEVMAAKVKHAQALLDAIACEDFKRIQAEATALVRISDGAEFLNYHKTEEYMVQARMFRRAVATMADKAADRNIDGVMLAYQDMSLRCLQCHQYTRTRKRD